MARNVISHAPDDNPLVETDKTTIDLARALWAEHDADERCEFILLLAIVLLAFAYLCWTSAS